MKSKKAFLFIAILTAISFCFCTGCVERKITITTEPSGALVLLNDEEIGTSPVTVGFEWYGDFAVCLSKDGYQTLKTHQAIKRPIRDRFPIDLFDDMASSRINQYNWHFKLEPLQPVDKDAMIKSATELQKQALVPAEIQPVKKAKKVKKPKEKITKTDTVAK